MDTKDAFEKLLAAIEDRNLIRIKEITKSGVNLNNEREYRNPLGKAIELGDMEIIECLIEEGADINFETPDE